MRLLYNRVFKNSQVTYGSPYQIRIPLTLQNIRYQEDTEGEDEIESDDLVDITEETESILEKARKESETIVKEAEYEARRITKDALSSAEKKAKELEESAWQKGFDEGCQAAKEQYESIIAEAESIKDSAAIEHDKVLAGMEAEIIDMVMDVAKKVIGKELEENDDNILYIVKQAIDSCANKNNIIIKVSLNDYESLVKNKEKLLAAVEGIGEIDIKQDVSLKAGACILETPFGNIDAGVQTRLRKIEEAFKEILEGK